MHRGGDPSEGRHVGPRLLAPRVPGAVHLMDEPQEHGRSPTVVAVEQASEVLHHRLRDPLEPRSWLEGDQQHGAGLPGLPRGLVEPGAFPPAHRHLVEHDDDRGRVSEPVGVGGERVPRPVDRRPEPRCAPRRRQLSGRAGRRDRRGRRGAAVSAGGGAVTPRAGSGVAPGERQERAHQHRHGPPETACRSVGRLTPTACHPLRPEPLQIGTCQSEPLTRAPRAGRREPSSGRRDRAGRAGRR